MGVVLLLAASSWELRDGLASHPELEGAGTPIPIHAGYPVMD